MTTDQLTGHTDANFVQFWHKPTLKQVALRCTRGLGAIIASFFIDAGALVAVLFLLVTGLPLSFCFIGQHLLGAALGVAGRYSRFKKDLAAWQGEPPWQDGPPDDKASPLANLRTPRHTREVAYSAAGALFDFALTTPILGWFMFLAILEVRAWPGYDMAYLIADTTVLVCLFILTFPVAWLMSALQIGLTKLFLAPDPSQARIERLETARAQSQFAEAASLSQIERDLHDGPQQKLLRTGMDLAALERRLDEDDLASVRALVTELRQRNDETLADVRAIARGFAPPVLAEKGLREAVLSLAATSTVPAMVSCEPDADDGLPEATARAVYFTIAEALANVAKHAQASAATVLVKRTADAIRADIGDNGCGGAAMLAGHGLEGLATRVASLGGTLDVDSRPDMGTHVMIKLPLAGLTPR